jgi:hypothetical protein
LGFFSGRAAAKSADSLRRRFEKGVYPGRRKERSLIFFTRELYEGMQVSSPRETRAEREWAKRAEIYQRYREVISPLLPAAVARLGREGLHDAIVLSAAQTADSLVLLMDTSNALTTLRGRRPVRLTFRGVRRRMITKRLVGAWWVADEVHLSSRARYALHVLFHQHEWEVEADRLVIERTAVRR